MLQIGDFIKCSDFDESAICLLTWTPVQQRCLYYVGNTQSIDTRYVLRKKIIENASENLLIFCVYLWKITLHSYFLHWNVALWCFFHSINFSCQNLSLEHNVTNIFEDMTSKNSWGHGSLYLTILVVLFDISDFS